MDSLQIPNGGPFKLIVLCLNWTQFDVIFYSKQNCKAVFWNIKTYKFYKSTALPTHLNIRWPWFQLWSSCFFTFRSTFVFHLFHFKLLELQQKEKLFVSCHLDLWFRTKEFHMMLLTFWRILRKMYDIVFVNPRLIKNYWFWVEQL